MKAVLTLLLAIAFFPAPKSSSLKAFHFLAGTWKTENKENYETWVINSQGSLEGNSYKIRSGSKQISEQLTIKESADKIIYTATVPDQNNGKPIDFVWNKNIKDKYSFENPGHDFPQKIQYTKLNDTTLLVAVLGNGGKGFSYKVIRQKK